MPASRLCNPTPILYNNTQQLFTLIPVRIQTGILLSKTSPSNAHQPLIQPGQVAASQWLPGEPRLTRLPDGGVRVVAPAKINLTLWVGPRRSDGFHPVESIVATVSLVDRLTIRPSSGGCELTCTNADLACDENNLVIRAAQALALLAKRKPDLWMHLEKNIPIGAGLGGGSSDAAACLMAVNALWRLGYDNTRLAGVAAQLGSDVPLFLAGPLSLVRGRGEAVEPLGFDWPFWAVLLCPPFPLATEKVYRKFDELLTKVPQVATITDCQLGLHRPESAGVVIFNMLEPAACGVLPQLADWRKAMFAAGAANVQLCGSGSALVCLFGSLTRARQLVCGLSPRLRAWVRVVHGGHH
ncbi:MAG: 4-(cytidine 5'-diphospho)-2-C-methyl-D-erythritol kinase [Actinobacteria bacterium]|nr:4-(cytidine 5'-diphospho)-2-C-methyl-D-erythritol kinase [Actinomycetota bacterium]